jgi:hypothetical protein
MKEISLLFYGIVAWVYSSGEISQANEVSVTIEFNKKALNKNSNTYYCIML